MTALRLTTVGQSGAWRGALRAGTRNLAACGHSHANRYTGHTGSAQRCMATLVRAARNPELADIVVAAAVAGAARARSLGARITDEEARERAEATLDDVRAVLREHPDFHLPRPPGIFTPGIVCGCCRPTEENR